MRSIIQVSDDLEGKLKARFKNITLGNKKGEPPVKSSEDEDVNHAVFFSFDFTVDNENYGNVTIYLADKKGLEVLYSKNITDNIGSNKHEWFKFLQGIRDFAMRNMLTFHPRDISRDALDTRDLKTLAKSYVDRPTTSEVTESKMSNLFGSKKSSYQNLGPVKLIVRHNSAIDETKMGARSRNIHSIYVETQDGERFKVPTNNLMAGRVMARHISNGGSMHDAFGKHVMEMVNQLKEMRYFVLSSKRYNFEDATTKDMVETAIESYNKVRETLHKLKGQRGYAAYMESFTEEQQQEAYQMSEELRDRFVKRIFDERLSQAMPHVAKAYAAKIRESNMLSEKLNQFEAGEFKFGLTESDREMLGIIEFADSNVFMRKMLEEIGTKLAEQDRQLSDFAARTSANWDSTSQIQKEMAAKLVRSFIKEMNAIKSGKTTKQEATMAPPQDSVLKEGVWEIPRTPAKVKKLIDMLSRPLPAGTDGDNATNALYGVFGDDELFDAIADVGEKKPEADVRKLVINRLLVALAKPENIRASAREIETIATALEQIKGIDVGAAYADKIDMILNKYSEYAQRRFDEQGVEEDAAEYQDQIDRFLAGGGKIQSVPTKPPRKSERLGGSRHIGGGGDRPKSRIRGISANTQGTKVIGLPEQGVAEGVNKNDDKFYVVSGQGIEHGPFDTREQANAKKDKAPAHGYKVVTGKQAKKLFNEGVAEGKTVASGLWDWQKKALKHDTYEKYVAHCNRYDYPHFDKRTWRRWKNAFDNMGTPSVAEGARDNAMTGLQKTIDFAKQHGYKIYRSPTGRKMRFVNSQLNHEIRASVDNDGDSINVNYIDYLSDTSGNDDASYFDEVFKDAYEQALKDSEYRKNLATYDDDDDVPHDRKYWAAQKKKLKQGIAEDVNDYLWHGSKSNHEVLYPKQAVDTGGAKDSNKNAVYATPNAKFAIAMGLTTPGSDTGMFPDDPQMVLFKGQIRKGEMVYLHKVPKDLFIKHNGREWYSKPDVKEVKPIEVKAIPVDQWLHLIRQATPQDWKLRQHFLDKAKTKEQGVAEGPASPLTTQQLATISDEALDKAYGYGRSTPGNTFGWQANLMSAAYAKKLIDAGNTDIEKISDAIHKGWNVTAEKFVQNPDQFDDTEKLRQSGKLEAKLQQRAKLMKINYTQLPEEEKEKDRVVARALLAAMTGQQGVVEAKRKSSAGSKPAGQDAADTEKISPYERRVRELEAEGMTRSDAQGVADLENLDDWVAEDFGKTVKQGLKKIKRGVAGWGAFDKDSPQDLVKRNREYDDATVQLLRKGGDVTKGSPADLQRRVLDREAARRGLGETKTAKSK